MKYCKFVIWSLCLSLSAMMAACSDACEYLDTDTDNPSFVRGYEVGDDVSHPESMAYTKWVRGTGLKYNAYGQEIQGFVESMDFFSADSVVVKMSEGCTSGTWMDDSNTAKVPAYEFNYSPSTGQVQVLRSVKEEKDGKVKVSKVTVFTAVVTQGRKEVLTVCHYGDTPVQSYLVRQ